jgi:bifunctional DNA-binding transcriptional regulator/antitoxin component of YhaV-PrlF toxin-antitoxin module
MKVLFDAKTVQKMERVVLGEALWKNAGLRGGDEVEICFDAVHKPIIMKRASDSEAQDRAPANKSTQQGKKG